MKTSCSPRTLTYIYIYTKCFVFHDIYIYHGLVKHLVYIYINIHVYIYIYIYGLESLAYHQKPE